MSIGGFYVEVTIAEGVRPEVRLVLELRNLIARQYEDRFSDPKQKREYDVAMAMFIDKHHDSDPWELSMGQTGAPPDLIGAGAIAIRFPMQPAWATYLPAARDWLRIQKRVGTP